MSSSLGRGAAGGPGWRRPDTERRRSWLVALLAFALIVVYLCVWALYSGSHTYPRYRQLAAGASATYGVEHYRVLSLTASASAASDGDQPVPAPANTVWVVAEIEVTIDRREDVIGCDLQLVGPDGRTWATMLGAPFRSKPQTCDDDKVTPGRPYDYEAIYQIPGRDADQLRGLVVVNDRTGAPSQVIRPG